MTDQQQGQMALGLGGVEPAEAEQPEAEWEMDWSYGQEVIVQEQRAIAVYTNRKEGIVIRQERAWDEEEDVVIILSTEVSALRVIEAIQREIRSGKNGG